MYQKEIIYMGLYKDGSRIGSAGFLKVENKGFESRLYLKVQNVPLGINGRFPIRVYGRGGWKEIKPITVQDGGGNWEENLAENMDRTVIQIMLSGGYVLEGKSKYAPETVTQKITETIRKVPEEVQKMPEEGRKAPEEAPRMPEEVMKVSEEVPKIQEEIQRMPEEPNKSAKYRSIENTVIAGAEGDAGMNKDAGHAKEEDIPVSRMQEMPEVTMQNNMEQYVKAERHKETENPQTIIITEELPRRKTGNTVVVPQNAPEYSLKEDKWEQILDTYEQIHPYGDERVYVKLEPKDFVILQSKYQHLVNNSFLLHGFYNYRYIILGKEQDYYLGVPGVFYEREKMVALMFGFEAFECPGGNVRAGEFGYYLRKVEL